MGRLKEPRAFDPLVALMKDGRPSVRGAACSALGELGNAEAVDPLSGALKDYEDTVREAAAVALGRLRDPGADQALVDFVKSEPQRSHAKLAAVTALARRGIARRRRSPKVPVWIGAAMGLGALGLASVLRLFEGLGPFNALLAAGAVLGLYLVWEWDRNQPDWRYLVRWRGEVFPVEGFAGPPPEIKPPEVDPRWGGSGWGFGSGRGG